jgi:hypothetical protein
MLINRLMNRYRKLHPDLDDVPAGTDTQGDENVEVSDGLSEDDINELTDFSPEVTEDEPPVEPEANEPEPAAPSEEDAEDSDPVDDNNDPEEVVEPVDEPEPEPEPDPTDPEKALADWKTKLAEQYTVSEEDAEMVLTNPEKILPQMAANIHSQIMMEVTKTMSQAIPQLIAQTLQAQPGMVSGAMKAHENTETRQAKFFETFPKLSEHKKTVATAAQTVQTNFPDLSLEDQLQKTGQVAMAMLGLQMTPKEEPVATPAAEPFIPASTGSSSSDSTPVESEWEEFI